MGIFNKSLDDFFKSIEPCICGYDILLICLSDVLVLGMRRFGAGDTIGAFGVNI